MISLIFDIDGTLWNASKATAKGWNKGLKNLKITKTVTDKDVENVAGKPYEECIEILFPNIKAKHPSLPEILDEYENEIVKKEGGVFYENAISGIKELSQNFPIYIISNCQTWYLQLFLKFSQIENYIQDYDCNGMSNVPKGEMIKNMMKKYSLKNPIYIGDTADDEKSAKLANCKFIHISYGFGKVKNNPLSFPSFQELVEYFQNIKI